MVANPYFAEIAALIGDPARANILAALMDGRALTASELAYVAGITPQTASGHLSRMLEARLVTAEKQGRHRYFRLGGEPVARAIEALMVLSQDGPKRHRPTGPRDGAMRFARTCYDHLAGTLGVAVTDALMQRGYLVEDAGDFTLTPAGEQALRGFGVAVDAPKKRKRAFARRCLDWSERRAHLGGALGSALLDRFEAEGWIARTPDCRTVTLTPQGKAGLAARFGIEGLGAE
jgi:DNA-binding transcriptional ArsR family regulator